MSQNWIVEELPLLKDIFRNNGVPEYPDTVYIGINDLKMSYTVGIPNPREWAGGS